MKKLSNQEMKKIAKSTLALVLAGTFAFSPMAMANEDTDTVDLRSYENLTTVSEEEIEKAEDQVENLEETNPSLIPGDFFYFAKIALEKIKLAFTFDNAKEAELLAGYASERLAEASALFAEGKEAEALMVIEEAVEYMENSQIIIDEEAEEDDQIAERTNPEEDDQENTDSEDNKGDGIPAEEQTEEDSAADEDATEDASEEDSEEETSEENAKDPFEEIENVLRQNIIALTAAMEKVQNPVAKAALQKNIDKTYAKMAKKLAKLEEKYGELPKKEENTETEEHVVAEPVAKPESDLLPADEVEAPVEVTIPADEETAVPAVIPAKTEKEQASPPQTKVKPAPVKQEHKAEKQVVKQQKQEVKQQQQQQKQQQKETKQQAKQEKHAGKQSNNQSNQGNEKEGKGKEKH